jgi:hypothetical protein
LPRSGSRVRIPSPAPISFKQISCSELHKLCLDTFQHSAPGACLEVRAIDEVALPDLPKPDPKMLQIAEKIVEQQSGDFDPSGFATATRMPVTKAKGMRRAASDTGASVPWKEHGTGAAHSVSCPYRKWHECPYGRWYKTGPAPQAEVRRRTSQQASR